MIVQKTKIGLFLFVMLLACEQEENPNKIPDDLPRFDELKDNYQSILTSADQGWITEYQPNNNSGIFHILMNFEDNGTVSILSDISAYDSTTNEVFYAVKGATYPELVFETFCVWHQLYEVADGDFQFRIVSIDENTVELGRVNSSSTQTVLTFTRATADDYQKMSNLRNVDQLLSDFYANSDQIFKVMQFEEANVKGLIDFNFATHQVYLNVADDNGNSTSSIANYTYDEQGIVFSPAVEIGGNTITRFDVSQTVDTAINLSNPSLENGIMYATDLPDFEFTGAVDQFNEYTFFVVESYSESLDTLEQQIQEAGAFVFAQIYRDYVLSASQRYNALTFVIVEESGDFDFYGFHIDQYIRLGEDRIRFRWTGGRDSNVTPELLDIFRNYVFFFFDQQGFKIVPLAENLIFVSYANPKNYLVVFPVS